LSSCQCVSPVELVVKQTLVDLITTEFKITIEEKNHSVFRLFKKSVMGLWGVTLIGITTIPDLDQYWRPKFEDFLTSREKIGTIVDKETSLEAILEEASKIFSGNEQRAITGTGRELPALSPSKEDVEPKKDFENNP